MMILHEAKRNNISITSLIFQNLNLFTIEFCINNKTIFPLYLIRGGAMITITKLRTNLSGVTLDEINMSQAALFVPNIPYFRR